MSTMPRILVVDDDWEPGLEGLKVTVTRPEDDDFVNVLGRAQEYDALLIDQNLNEPGALSMKASDGASLVGHFRSWARSKGVGMPPLVITTSEVEAFASEVPMVGPAIPLQGSFVDREHRLAPSLDVEWLLEKKDLQLSKKVVSIANAWARVRTHTGSPDVLRDILGIPTFIAGLPNWSATVEMALAEINLSFQLPDFDRRIADQSMMRWLLHKVLPYPGILVSDVHASWILGVTRTSLGNFLPDRGEADPLFACMYRGPLVDLFPRRWWASGLDAINWNVDRRMTAQNAGRDDRQSFLNEISPGSGLVDRKTEGTVVTWTADLIESDIVDVDDAVQIRPPGWPIDAFGLWASKAEVMNDQVLRSMIVDTQGDAG